VPEPAGDVYTADRAARAASPALRVGVDLGGTFTDLVLRLPDGSLRVSTMSSTPIEPSQSPAAQRMGVGAAS
jgi:hypothetical protein